MVVVLEVVDQHVEDVVGVVVGLAVGCRPCLALLRRLVVEPVPPLSKPRMLKRRLDERLAPLVAVGMDWKLASGRDQPVLGSRPFRPGLRLSC